MRHWLFAVGLTLVPITAARAFDPPPLAAQDVAAAIRGQILGHIPTPLTQSQPGWGRQVESLTGRKMRNHGVWRKVRVSAINPAQTLTVEVRRLSQPEPTRTTFDLVVGLDVQIDFEQQIWERGLHLYRGSTQARAKVTAELQCEVRTRTEPGTGKLPDLVFRLGVTKADLRYSGLDFVHVGRIGGDGADVIGHALVDLLKTVRPSLEKELLAKANAGIVKAGDAREVRVSLGKLLKLN